MPELIRVVADVVVEDGLTEGRKNSIANEVSAHLRTLVMEQEDGVIKVDENFAHSHEHDGVEGCRTCRYFYNDSKNAATVIEA